MIRWPICAICFTTAIFFILSQINTYEVTAISSFGVLIVITLLGIFLMDSDFVFAGAMGILGIMAGFFFKTGGLDAIVLVLCLLGIALCLVIFARILHQKINNWKNLLTRLVFLAEFFIIFLITAV